MRALCLGVSYVVLFYLSILNVVGMFIYFGCLLTDFHNTNYQSHFLGHLTWAFLLGVSSMCFKVAHDLQREDERHERENAMEEIPLRPRRRRRSPTVDQHILNILDVVDNRDAVREHMTEQDYRIVMDSLMELHKKIDN